jgi:hypothetical protein
MVPGHSPFARTQPRRKQRPIEKRSGMIGGYRENASS